MAEPLIDPDCRNDKHRSCVGDPCECSCHAWEVELDPELAEWVGDHG